MTAVKIRIPTHDQVCNFCSANDAEVIARGMDFEYETCANEFTYVRCKSCGHLYLNPLPDPATLDIIYPANYGNFEENRNTVFTFKVKNWLDRRYLRKLTKGLHVERILDIGCADGRMLALCRDALPDVQCLEGIEFSRNSAKQAMERGFTVHVGSADQLKLPDNYFDLIFLQQVIEHVFDPTALVQKLYHSLRENGRVCFEMPTSEAIDRYFGGKRYWGGYHFPRHFNIFSERNFCTICERAGFTVISVAYRYQPVHWVWTVHHWLKEKGVSPVICEWFNIKNTWLMAIGTVMEALAKLVSGKAANMQIIVEKKPHAKN